MNAVSNISDRSLAPTKDANSVNNTSALKVLLSNTKLVGYECKKHRNDPCYYIIHNRVDRGKFIEEVINGIIDNRCKTSEYNIGNCFLIKELNQ